MKPDMNSTACYIGGFALLTLFFFLQPYCVLAFTASGIEPLSIPDADERGVSSNRYFGNAGSIQPTDVVEIDCAISHSWVGDLKILLTCPSGKQLVLASGIGKNQFSDGCPSDNLEITFSPSGMPLEKIHCESSDAADDQGISHTGSALKTGFYCPLSGFSALYGERLDGTWALVIIDEAAGNTGWLLDWDLRIDKTRAPLAFQHLPMPETAMQEDRSVALYSPVFARNHKAISIPFRIPDLMNVKLEMYNNRGRLTLAREFLFLKGENEFLMEKSDFRKGTYYFTITVQGHVLSHKMVVQ